MDVLRTFQATDLQPFFNEKVP